MKLRSGGGDEGGELMATGRCGYGLTLRRTFAPLGRGGHCGAAGQKSNLIGLSDSARECGSVGRLYDDGKDMGGSKADEMCMRSWMA